MNFGTWFETWSLDLQITFLLAPFVIGFSGMLMILVMAYRNLDLILHTFPNSQYVLRQKILWGKKGLYSRFILTSSLAAVALFPKGHIKRGDLLESEVRSLPHFIKHRMVIAWWLCFAGMAWLLLAVGLLKLTGD
ncbi:hypothetical protein NAV33_13095 [Pseudomonas stutzeri]|uniref:hypothetical protein n=1 Tax=Stutzerimonas stutzeri TaxID=316 RepID=UPI002109CCCE|nr:hypothetical protein [Stutzerimonas stutzeri]MCQ4312826.1 hypothetical protein [Stutzerimonas stutzeri]